MNNTDSGNTGAILGTTSTDTARYESPAINPRCILGFIAILVVAIFLRAWRMNAIFESSDQAIIAYLVQHSYGIKWLFGYSYGPVPVILQRTFAEFYSRAGLPIDETLYRLPNVLVSLAQVVLTFAILHRLRCSRVEALVGMLCCACLPTLVTDAHCAGSYLTVWLFAGSLAFWATLAYLDDRKVWQLVLAGLALFAHCLCNCYSFGLPIALLIMWCLSPRKSPTTPTTIRAAIVGWALPCLAALVAIVLMWMWTRQGQLGHLIDKHEGGTSGWQSAQLLGLPILWSGQFGYYFGVVSALGLIYGLVMMARGERRGLLVIWALFAAVPLILLSDWSRIGYAGAYLIETVYSGGLLGALLICWVYGKLSSRPLAKSLAVALAALLFVVLAVSTADECLGGGKLTCYSGVSTGWGTVRPDTGVKAAGWYVRKHVPPDAVVMTLHTNYGMEVTVAEFYLGRKVLASYDLPPEFLEPLLENMRNDINVLIVDSRHQQLTDTLADFERVATLRNRTAPVRYILGRRERAFPKIDEEVSVLNKLFDPPRHVPVPLPADPTFDRCLSKYQSVVQQLKDAHTSGSSKP